MSPHFFLTVVNVFFLGRYLILFKNIMFQWYILMLFLIVFFQNTLLELLIMVVQQTHTFCVLIIWHVYLIITSVTSVQIVPMKPMKPKTVVSIILFFSIYKLYILVCGYVLFVVLSHITEMVSSKLRESRSGFSVFISGHSEIKNIQSIRKNNKKSLCTYNIITSRIVNYQWISD